MIGYQNNNDLYYKVAENHDSEKKKFKKYCNAKGLDTIYL